MQKTHEPFPAGSLSTFVAVQRAGSISAAARLLHLSQPAVSRRLQALERRLGVALFDRRPDGLHLTDAGRALLPEASKVVAAEADAVRVVAERRAGAVGTVRVGAVGSLVEPHLTDALREVVERYPGVEMEVATGTSAQVVDLVRAGELDLGISYARPTDTALEVRHLADERLVVVCAPDHGLAGRSLAGPSFRDHRWLVFPDHGSHPETSGTIARRVLERHHVPPVRLRPVDSLSAQRSLAMAGYGLALLTESMVGDDLASGSLAIVAAPELEIAVPITLLTRVAAPLGPAVDAVTRLLLDGPAA